MSRSELTDYLSLTSFLNIGIGSPSVEGAGVEAVGGNNDLGAKILDRAREILRKHKTSKGTKLPPKSKPFEYYVKKAGGSV